MAADENFGDPHTSNQLWPKKAMR